MKSTSLKIPEKINNEMLQQVVKSGYGLRGKSKWIVEAIQAFLQMDDYVELINIASDMENNYKTLTFRLSQELVAELDRGILHARTKYPLMEGVQSNIIRASIMQRLIRDDDIDVII